MLMMIVFVGYVNVVMILLYVCVYDMVIDVWFYLFIVLIYEVVEFFGMRLNK